MNESAFSPKVDSYIEQAAKIFAEFSPGKKREYVDWIAEARQEATKLRRVAQAVEWIAEGKSRNWKYEKR